MELKKEVVPPGTEVIRVLPEFQELTDEKKKEIPELLKTWIKQVEESLGQLHCAVNSTVD